MAEDTPYTQRKFWQAYGELYWPELDENTELSAYCARLVDLLPERPSAVPLRILALGFGFGGVELPILYQLKRLAKIPLDLVVIDKAAEPLAFAEHLLRNGVGGIARTSAELARQFESFPEQGTLGEDQFPRVVSLPDGDTVRLFLDDLEWEPSDDEPTALCPELSNWHKRLSDALGSDYRFDVVIAAFSLFHIPFWRVPFFRALEFMREGGLFLHGRVEGDEALFEGRPGKKAEVARMAETLFRAFFSDPRAKRVLDRPRGATASRPFVIDEFLARMGPFGFERVNLDPTTAGYTVAVKMSLAAYMALLETKGFSTFRHIENEFITEFGDAEGRRMYVALCQSACAAITNVEPDSLEIDFVWSVHRVNARDLSAFPLHARFTASSDRAKDHSSRQSALIQSYRTEYEINGAASLQSYGQDTPFALARSVAQRLAQQGLLHDACIAIECSFFQPGSKHPDWCFMANPLDFDLARRGRQIAEISLYLQMNARRDNGATVEYSNTQTILEVLVPRLRKSSVFSYVIGNAEHGITHRPHRDFEEVRFTAPKDNDEIRVELQQWQQTLKRKPGKATRQFVFALNDFCFLEDIASGLRNKFWDESRLGEAVKRLRSQILRWRSLDEKTLEALAGVVTPIMVFRSECLKILTDIKFLVFFPATYEVGGTTAGRELLIGLYSRELTDAELESEFHKFGQVFERIKTHHVRAAGVEEALGAFSHEISKQVTWLMDSRLPALSRLFEINAHPRTNDPRDVSDWPVAAGAIKTNDQYAPQIAKWRVCPVPRLLGALADYLFLWAGTDDTIPEFSEGSDMLEDFVSAAAKVARNGCAARVMADANPRNMDKVAQDEREYERELTKYPDPERVKWDTLNARLVRSPTNRVELQQVRVRIFRAMVAALSNAFYHSPPGQAAKVTVTYRDAAFTFKVVNRRNRFTDMNSGYGRGTEAVVRNSLADILGYEPTVSFGPDPQDQQQWATSFTLPATVSYRRATNPVEWLEIP